MTKHNTCVNHWTVIDYKKIISIKRTRVNMFLHKKCSV